MANEKGDVPGFDEAPSYVYQAKSGDKYGYGFGLSYNKRTRKQSSAVSVNSQGISSKIKMGEGEKTRDGGVPRLLKIAFEGSPFRLKRCFTSEIYIYSR